MTLPSAVPPVLKDDELQCHNRSADLCETGHRLRTGVTEDHMCAGGTATANSDPRKDLRSGQLQHDVKKYVRGHESGDVVGL
jgi:hypothetical protein